VAWDERSESRGDNIWNNLVLGFAWGLNPGYARWNNLVPGFACGLNPGYVRSRVPSRCSGRYFAPRA
jgi:hypothetical protein